MGTRGLFQVYDESTKTYTYYYIHYDSLIVLKGLRTKLRQCKSIKSIRKVITGLITAGTLRENELNEPGAEGYSAAMCWPSLEFSLTIELMDFTRDYCNEKWQIDPVRETTSTGFILARYQRPELFRGYNASNGTRAVKERLDEAKATAATTAYKAQLAKMPAAVKRVKETAYKAQLAKMPAAVKRAKAAMAKAKIPKAPQLSAATHSTPRPRLTQEEKDARAAARALLKFQQDPKAMAPRSELAPWIWDPSKWDGLVY
jgi:hypothetical protein